VEETPEFYRFQTSLKSGETKTFTVKEERDVQTTVQLTNSSDDQIRYFLSLSQASPALKQKLREALQLKGQWDVVRRELQQVQADLQRLNADQDRIRKNLRETPPEAEVYKKYLKKLDDQEKEIDALTARQKELMSREFEARKRYEDYLANLSDE
jgi:septal ring factor EnvC (AmiA/AmiB activator)